MRLEQKVKFINFLSLLVVAMVILVVSMLQQDLHDHEAEINDLEMELRAGTSLNERVTVMQSEIDNLTLEQQHAQDQVTKWKALYEKAHTTNETLRQDLKRHAGRLREQSSATP
jgi:biopolymer transport protein ExbB/TolQ